VLARACSLLHDVLSMLEHGFYTNAHSTLAILVGVGDGDPCGSKDTKVVDALKTTDAPEDCHIGTRASPPKRWWDE